MDVAIRALDALGVALAEHGHVWSAKERRLYERAIAALLREQRKKET